MKSVKLIEDHFKINKIRVVQSWIRAFGFLQLDDNLIDLLVKGTFPKSQSPFLVWLSQNHSKISPTCDFKLGYWKFQMIVDFSHLVKVLVPIKPPGEDLRCV